MSRNRCKSYVIGRDLATAMARLKRMEHERDLERSAALSRIAPAQRAANAKRGIPGPPVVR